MEKMKKDNAQMVLCALPLGWIFGGPFTFTNWYNDCTHPFHLGFPHVGVALSFEEKCDRDGEGFNL